MSYKFITCIFCFAILHNTSNSFGQDIMKTNSYKLGIKLGVTMMDQQIKDVPLSGGRGLGCSIFHTVEDSKTLFGGKIGLYYQHKLGRKTSVIFGPEVFLTGDSKTNYNISFSCVNGQVSKTQGFLSFPNFTFSLPIIFRRETSFFDIFFEIGGYHDLGTSISSTYTYERTEFLNFMFQPHPDPIITNGEDKLKGTNYGLIFGLGNSNLLPSEKIELRCQYFLGLSKSVPLGEYKYMSHSGLDLSASLRF